jgi:hypothetical protein
MMSAKEVAYMEDVPDETQRWTARRKAAVVLSIVKGETPARRWTRRYSDTSCVTVRMHGERATPLR